jgi:hypothetical protein
MRHKIVIQNLYEYVEGRILESDRKAIEQHLDGCAQCTKELTELQHTMKLVPRNFVDPSKSRPEMFWQHFAERVQRRVFSPNDEKTLSWQDFILGWVGHRRSFVVGFGSAIALIMLTVSVWQLLNFRSEQKDFAGEESRVSTPQIRTASLEARTQDYLERSKILLVGLVNADPETPELSNLTFGKQREVSKKLVRESRELTAALNEPSQQRLRRLISDLELILIQIADIEAQDDSPAIELVKSGLERRNILLKINMEELQRPGQEKHKPNAVNNQKGS